MAQEGWICPKCGRVMAPWVPECSCNYAFKDNVCTNTLKVTTGGSELDRKDWPQLEIYKNILKGE